MGECWYKDCCISEHPDNLRCGKPEVEDGNEKMRMLIQSEVCFLEKILNMPVSIVTECLPGFFRQRSAEKPPLCEKENRRVEFYG